MAVTIDYAANKRQRVFHSSTADEVVYGGAKGGGKSCALVMEALIYCLKNAGATVYLFRESYDDLESNLIEEWKKKVPWQLYAYNESKHIASLVNGSRVLFRYMAGDADAYRYQGRSMDFIGVDELTKHSEKAVQVLLSCLRSPKGFKPMFRGSCNPGGKGHSWVKKRYVSATEYGKKGYTDEETGNTIEFVPANVYDNDVLMTNDPAYVRRLENLPEDEKKAYLYGDWDIFEGQYFTEFDRSLHMIEPFALPAHWRRYVTMDYGLDMFACYFIAVDENGRAYVYKEIYKNNLLVTDAADAVLAATEEKIYQHIGPPDLWNRHKDTGKSTAEIFAEKGIYLAQASNDRVQGWYNLHEWLKPATDEQGAPCADLRIFSSCVNLLRCLPELRHDEKNPNDVSKEPHEITHAPDAIRYFIAGRPAPAILAQLGAQENEHRDYEEEIQDILNFFG